MLWKLTVGLQVRGRATLDQDVLTTLFGVIPNGVAIPSREFKNHAIQTTPLTSGSHDLAGMLIGLGLGLGPRLRFAKSENFDVHLFGVTSSRSWSLSASCLSMICG